MSQLTPEQQYEEQLRVASRGDGGGIVDYLLHRAKPHLPPWLAGAGAGLASLPAHHFWGDNPWTAAGLTLTSVALTGATWWAGRSTTPQRRLHSAITVAASTSWFTAASIAGPGTGPLGDLFFMGAPALALSWNIRQIMRRTPEGGAGADGGFLEKVGLAKTQVVSSEVKPNRATFDLQLPRGELTPEDVSKNITRIAGALDVPKTAIRVQEDPESASRVQLTVVPRDLLKNTTPCPGPSHPGGSIADPVVVGQYEDGTQAVLYFPGDPKSGRNAAHFLVMGMTGSGKSEGALTALAEVCTRRDVIVWASDPAKADQTLGPLLPAIDWAALDMASTKAMTEALPAVIPARTAWLAKYGYKQWEPACAQVQADGSPGMPYLVAWFEEAAKTIRETDDDVFTGIAQEARSAGVSLVVSMQRASGNQVSTDTRSSLGSSWCHGVGKEKDALFALDDEVLDAGAAPHVWKDKKPGYSYLVANGVPESLWATPLRDYLSGSDYLAWVVVNFAQSRAGIDIVTAGAAARAVDRAFTHRTRHPLPGGMPELEEAMRAPDEDEDDYGPDAYEQHDDQDDYDYDDEEGEFVDPEAELPPVTRVMHFRESAARNAPRAQLTPAQARQAMEELLDEFEDEGRTVIGPADFMEHCDRHGRSRSWVSGQVAQFVMAGRLAETSETGRYRIVQMQPA
ncbi:plasmid transfer protein TraB [Streptomyces caniscabiei]|uniref:plasmid transfer protein TraB n=1 Tax=Streptomyces caniscabiei TaxID=2746961 RepID=UPI001CE128DF|nr:plasmid transfer protein TraB [Streptomyces caniscabiei]MDX3733265.1 plasmid transfer protein TraB [Streptomyces caniscabiei]